MYILLNEKEFRILSIILSSDKPLTTTEIAAQAGYPRKTLEPYINQFAEFGFLFDSSDKNRTHNPEGEFTRWHKQLKSASV